MKTILQRMLLLILLCISALPPTYAEYIYFNIDGFEYASYNTGEAMLISGPDQSSVTIPETVEYEGKTYTVTGISGASSTGPGKDEGAFYGYQNLTSITIPKTVTLIGDHAFYNCTNLSSVHINDLSAWCRIRFGNVYDRPDANPLSIAGHLFLNGSEITDLIIPSDVTSIKQHAFRGCSNLTSLTIPATISSIDKTAFIGCNSIKTLNYNAKDCKFENRAFSGTGADSPFQLLPIVELNIGPDVIIPTDAFSGLTHLTELRLANSVRSIGENAFKDCINLPSISIPSSVTTIGNNAFCNCTSLTSLVIPKSITYIHNIWDGCTALKKISVLGAAKIEYGIPEGLTELILNKDCDLQSCNLPFISASTLNVTQTKAEWKIEQSSKLKVIDDNGNFTTPTYYCSMSYNGNSYDKYSFDGNIFKVWGMVPRQYCYLIAFHHEISSVNTKPIECWFKDIGKYADMLIMSVDWDAGDYPIEKFQWQGRRWNSNSKIITIRYDQFKDICYSSSNGYHLDFYFNDLYGYSFASFSKYISFPDVKINNVSAQATSYTSARLSAEMNLSTGAAAGIEWRRNDAPSNVPSNIIEAPVVEERMLGELIGLRDDVYYQFRPYYNRDGKITYGDWVGFYTGDAGVWFEPEIGTLPARIEENSATLSGYVVAGTDNVTSRGFELKLQAPQARSEDWQQIPATGTYMTAEATELSPATTYVYRAFAVAGDKTFYGQEVSFTTPELNGIHDTINAIDDSDVLNATLRIRLPQSKPEIKIVTNGIETARCSITSINGATMYSGIVAVTGHFEIIDTVLPRGFYILHVEADGIARTIKFAMR